MERQFITLAEVRHLREHALKSSKNRALAARNELIVLCAYRFGLDCSEIIDLKWSDIVFAGRMNSTITIRRRKHEDGRGGFPTTHRLASWERDRFRLFHDKFDSVYVLPNNDGQKMTEMRAVQIMQKISKLSRIPNATIESLRESCVLYIERTHGQAVASNFLGIVNDQTINYSRIGFLQERSRFQPL